MTKLVPIAQGYSQLERVLSSSINAINNRLRCQKVQAENRIDDVGDPRNYERG